jgi:RNA polymerase sigma factor (sigma-70 family)
MFPAANSRVTAISNQRITNRPRHHRSAKRQLQSKDQQATDAAVFDELSRPHTKRLFRTIYRITRNREDAEDALQDSLLQAFVHMKDFDGRSSFSTWLTRVAINSALMVLRKRRNSRSVSLDSTDKEDGTLDYAEVPDHAPSPEKQYAARERDKAVRGALQALRPSSRRVIELQQFEELPMKEVSEAMDLSLAAAKSRLFHAKAALKKSSRLRAFGDSKSRQSLRMVIESRNAHVAPPITSRMLGAA